MMYMSSTSGNDGSYALTVTFKPGTDLNVAQVLVQNRVNLAERVLPEIVRRRGVTVTLAPAGAQVLAQAGPDRQALVVSLVFEALDDKDLDLLEGVFTTMLESIERHFPAR
jgi:multidrug efflux pump subunit AcrB